MSSGAIAPTTYSDFSALTALKGAARAEDPAAIREVARQFESLFTHMLLKSMREAKLGEGLGESDTTEFYRDMYDQQLALSLSQGEGLGLANRLVEQLLRAGGNAAGDPVTDATQTTRASGGQSPQAFIEQLQPAVGAAAERLGVDPSLIIAHAALETGWGKSLPADATGSSLNMFGIKAHDTQPAARALTTEYVNGAAERRVEAFRRYSSIEESVTDYAALIAGSPRYAAALNTGSDAAAFASALQRGGYATDPLYVQKLVATVTTVRQQMAEAAIKSPSSPPIDAHG
jgi:peptidoglycan hydrolase FlgJ